MSYFRDKIKLFDDKKPIRVHKVLPKQQEISAKPAPSGRKRQLKSDNKTVAKVEQ